MPILIQRSARQRQWVGVAIAAALLAAVFWWPRAKAPAPAATPPGIGAEQERSFDELRTAPPGEPADRNDAPATPAVVSGANAARVPGLFG